MRRFIKSVIKRTLYPVLGLSVPDREIHIYKTLLFNFLAFGVKGLIKTPVYIYGHTKIYRVGKINIHCPTTRGILKIGQLAYKSQGITKFLNAGTIDIYGYTIIGGATIIENRGNIVFGGYNQIGDGASLIIREKFVLGEQSRLGFHTFVMDSDDHFTSDAETLVVHKNKKPIYIGKYNWIANKTVIKKGVKTPDYLIVASANALLTKDYTSLPPYSVIGGSPAKLLKSGIRRIYNQKEEARIKKYFKEHPSETSLKIDLGGLSFDEYCSMNKISTERKRFKSPPPIKNIDISYITCSSAVLPFSTFDVEICLAS